MSSLTILHVNDSPNDRLAVARALGQAFPHAQVRRVTHPDALEEALTHPVDLVIAEVPLSWGDGQRILARAREHQPDVPVIVVAEGGEEQDARGLVEAGVDGYLVAAAQVDLSLIAAAQTALRAAAARRQASEAEAALQRTRARQQRVVEIARALADGRHDVAVIADLLAHAAAAAVGDFAAVQVFLEDQVPQAMLVTHDLAPSIVERLQLAFRAAPDVRREGITGRVLASGEPMLLNDRAEVLAHVSLVSRDIAEELGLTALLAVPLLAGDRPCGVLMCGRVSPGRPYGEEELNLAQELAAPAAVAIEAAAASRHADEALRARERLLSMAIHEIQNPLAGIKGLAQLLRRLEESGRLTADRLREGLRSIDESIDRLTRIVQDLLDLSRSQTGQLSVALEPIDLGQLLDRLVRRYAAAGVTLVCTEHETGPVLADPARLEQVFTNVLDNAVKYSPPGAPIVVRLGREAAGLLVTVTDHGIGLPSDALETIFEPYRRASNATAAQIPGLGLGLFIARQIVEQHAGVIAAESPGEGRGTTIRIWLPAAPAS
ncbi:MAG: ATP-binding protein [Chloroflexota bacterium]|nr:ATP-binding protein [Chloroflexota bacterium]